MNVTNPYSSPQTDVSTNLSVVDNFRGLDFKQLKKLYYRSCNVNAITLLLGLGLIAMAMASMLPSLADIRLIIIGIAVYHAVAVTGLVKRTSWGRILGILACIIALISIPIGTIIGASGLLAFCGAPELFGVNRVTHRELKDEFNLQKANLKKG